MKRFMNTATQNLPLLIKRVGWLAKNIRTLSYIPVGIIVFLVSLIMLFEPWGGVAVRVGIVLFILGVALLMRCILLARISPLLNTVMMMSSFGSDGVSSLMGMFSSGTIQPQPDKGQTIDASPVDTGALKDALAVKEKVEKSQTSKGFSLNQDEIAGALKLVQAFSKAAQKKQ